MKRWTNRAMTVIGILLILAAIAIFIKPHIENYLQQRHDQQQITQYEKKHTHQSKVTIPKDKSQAAGVLSVPDAKIKTPVYPGPATPTQLNRGVSFAEDDESLDDQNIAIAGHTFTDRTHYQFTNLPAAKKNSKVYFKVVNQTRKYKIVKIYDVKPSDVHVLDEHQGQKNQLTLITCDNYNKQTGEWDDRKIFIAQAI